MPTIRSSKLFVLSALALIFAMVGLTACGEAEKEEEGMAKVRNSGQTLEEVVNAPAYSPPVVPAAGPSGFTPQTRVGFTTGDQWEPAIAADDYGHIYILTTQYEGVPGCLECASPTMILQVSNDRGLTWGSPTVLYREGAAGGQWDPQVTIDPLDGRTVYASWLQNGKSDIAVAKSTDYGVTWATAIADSTNAGTDKPILAVRGQEVYVAYNHAQKVWVSSSHDGGVTWTSANVNKTGKLGWSLAGGGAITPNGNVFFSWAGYSQNGGAKGPVYLYVSKSTDRGATWTTKLIDTSGAPPDCSAYYCGWAYLGAQMTMAVDSGGTLYGLWNAGTVDKGPERIYFAKSTDSGNTWSAKAEVSTAPAGTSHAFPSLTAGTAGDLRISWMDSRAGALWNTYYRSSTNSGTIWSSEVDLSTYVEGYSYIFPNGFSYPFGDYYEMDIDDQGNTHAVWGESLNYDTPGSCWYTHGR